MGKINNFEVETYTTTKLKIKSSNQSVPEIINLLSNVSTKLDELTEKYKSLIENDLMASDFYDEANNIIKISNSINAALSVSVSSLLNDTYDRIKSISSLSTSFKEDLSTSNQVFSNALKSVEELKKNGVSDIKSNNSAPSPEGVTVTTEIVDAKKAAAEPDGNTIKTIAQDETTSTADESASSSSGEEGTMVSETEETSQPTPEATPTEETPPQSEFAPSDGGSVLTKSKGVNQGPNGKETYYNLNMSKVVENMHNQGFEGEYWVRDDGVKMFGDYVIVAANLDVHPRGSIVESSLGTAIVCDTGGFAADDPNQLDIATNW